MRENPENSLIGTEKKSENGLKTLMWGFLMDKGQKAKKPVLHQDTNRADCPVCGNMVRGIDKPFGNWCSHCGQKLNWSDIP